ncbi:hypothetical protein BD309DRAFT_493679 [Dichomitus squalens]|nr:hypothetical protein BD309DRAFT_493679 [Dichomitus squalens]
MITRCQPPSILREASCVQAVPIPPKKSGSTRRYVPKPRTCSKLSATVTSFLVLGENATLAAKNKPPDRGHCCPVAVHSPDTPLSLVTRDFYQTIAGSGSQKCNPEALR